MVKTRRHREDLLPDEIVHRMRAVALVSVARGQLAVVVAPEDVHHAVGGDHEGVVAARRDHAHAFVPERRDGCDGEDALMCVPQSQLINK